MKKYLAQDKYDKENCIRFSIKLNKKTDTKAIEKLDELTEQYGNRQAAIKSLLK